MCKLAQQYDSRIAQAFESVVPNNPQCDDLVKSLASPFDQRLWDELQSETSLFKLTWKQQFPSVVEGKDTFYAKLLQQKLLDVRRRETGFDAGVSVDWYRLCLPLVFSSGNKYYRPQRYKPSYSEDGAKPTHII